MSGVLTTATRPAPIASACGQRSLAFGPTPPVPPAMRRTGTPAQAPAVPTHADGVVLQEAQHGR